MGRTMLESRAESQRATDNQEAAIRAAFAANPALHLTVYSRSTIDRNAIARCVRAGVCRVIATYEGGDVTLAR